MKTTQNTQLKYTTKFTASFTFKAVIARKMNSGFCKKI